ncbi:hypothetical protein S-CBP1_0046 [Synechococcus phage S-CBP1]|uniref:Uncharacterized protein n=1 Tax=Synechococcus phage S-CBP1 TaxID=1273711 RepID=A0A096VKG8_9CAUD|nr:hypothetical protein S-CBP1_0046 [Synechococcus phage S-CBP1]AGK86551.1 hypothetical protein S-CBP1_0046 [Synechococcus phage S-CBP1]
MSKRKMPSARRQHRKLLDLQKAGVYTTEDPQGKLNVFKEYQQYNIFPQHYNDPIEMQNDVKEKIKQGRSKKQAMQELGIQFDVFESNGNIKGRIFRDSMSPGMQDAIDSRVGVGEADNLRRLERKYWNAGVAENREIAPTLGMSVNEGHIDTSASGAPASNRAAGLESAVLNQMNGRSAANPSRPVSNNERLNIGVANTKVSGLYEAKLQESGLLARSGTERLLNPYVSALLGSDERSRYIPADQLETFNRTFQDLADQGLSEVAMYDHAKSGGSLDAKSLATAGLEARGISTYAQAPSNPAPVYTTKVDPRTLGSVNVKAPAPKPRPSTNSSGSNLLRIARNTAPMWASLPLGAAVFGQSAHAAVTNPNADTVETALWDGANLVADGLSLVPIPMVVAGAEAAQKTLGIAQAARQGQKYVQQQNLRPSAPMPRPAAVPQAQSRPRTATVARTRGQTMPTSAPIDPGKLFNNFIQSGYKAVFGNRES